MSESELPGEQPRLLTLRHYLTLQLDQVNEAIENAEYGRRPAGRQLPADLPRLNTLQRYLLRQLARVTKAIEDPADPRRSGPTAGRPRWVIMWRWTRKDTDRLGILHAVDCWRVDAGARTLTISEVRAAHRPGRRIEPCDICTERLPDTAVGTRR